MNKQVYMESVRGLAAMVVVVAHFMAAFYPAAVLGSQYHTHAPWESLFATTPLHLFVAGHFAVCIFFILSGYVLSLPYFGPEARDTDSLLSAVVKRPVRLGGLVLASILISRCLQKAHLFYNVPLSALSGSTPWFESFFAQPTLKLSTLVRTLSTQLFSIGPLFNAPLWTIQIELYGSFLTYGFLLLFRKSTLRFAAYAIALVMFRETLYHGFIFGMMFADLVKNYPALLPRQRPKLSWALLLVGLYFSSHPHHIPREQLRDTVFGILPKFEVLGGGFSMLGAICIFQSILMTPKLQAWLSGKVFAYLGRISYSMYAIHFLVLGSVTSWMFLQLYTKLGYGTACVISALAYLAVVVASAHYLMKYVDEPTTRMANRLGKYYLQTLGTGNRNAELSLNASTLPEAEDSRPLKRVG